MRAPGGGIPACAGRTTAAPPRAREGAGHPRIRRAENTNMPHGAHSSTGNGRKPHEGAITT
ncbi:hypothetical protein GZL_06650 [Streptomyces sp. 769]|nr:hypothetical protein GZL_06650 [Streptomyces sp. 769]